MTEKTGSLVGILYVKDTEDLIITCKSGITIRTGIADIREAGRATQGVTLMRLDNGDEIAAISQIEKEEEIVAETIAGAGTETPAPETQAGDDQADQTNTDNDSATKTEN